MRLCQTRHYEKLGEIYARRRIVCFLLMKSVVSKNFISCEQISRRGNPDVPVSHRMTVFSLTWQV